MPGFLSRFRQHLLVFLAVLGPGFITAVVDNDSGGIYTYSQAGARWGYLPLWTLLPITIALIVTQEMCSRMGAVTGKGLSDLIREEFGLRVTFCIMVVLVLLNLTNIMAEFAGVATSLDLFGVSKFISVPLVAVAVWFVAVKGNYQSVEKIFLFACVIYIAYVIAGFLVKPDWKEAMIYSVRPKLMLDSGYIAMLVGMVGTTIAPWMQFYLQAAVVEKGISANEYRESRIEVIVGCFMTSVIAFFIIVACAGAYRDHPTDIQSAKEAALALKPFGDFTYILFSAGLLNASVFAACILPLSTAYSVCEGLGFESGVNRRWREAPIFYWLYTLLIVVGAGIVLLPKFSMVQMILLSQVLNGMLLPVILIYMLLLINKKNLMNEWVNPPFYNVVTWTTVAVVIGMTLALTGITIRSPQ
ncbi:MAG TPA: Nramp family divalent metal transporter [Bryobacteraceae bacterium]|nr:Nramp family divalent metal transporter [Bryobacteraceae bacterium]